MSNKTKILILGGGFGGVYAALRLDKTLARRAAGVTGPSAGVYFATPPSLVASSKVSLSNHGPNTCASTPVGRHLTGR